AGTRRPAGLPVVEMQTVSKRYRKGGGIEDVTLEVGPGEVFGFLGPNGAGKTTTIRLLLDLIRPDRGTIRLFGLDPRRDGVAVRRRLGYLPGDLVLYDRLTAREVLSHFAHLRRGPSWQAIASLCERFDLEVDRPIRSLSKGNRQKVGLVQALMGTPELLLLDEPTSGLDPIVQHEVHSSLRQLVLEGTTVFLSSHVLSEVEQVADRVGMIRAGRVEAVERVDELRSRSVHLVEVRTASPLDPAAFSALPGVAKLDVVDHTAHLEIAGSLDPLIGELAGMEVADLSVREPDLEEVFLSFYASPSTITPAGREREQDHGRP
ncbi:MAG TPA: ABC transporter ATP-binding protein, partial [Acidimicrobiales bacterium]|nr:ABC transporter ATP-binding protein [Acidimicrobiales bacterium]